MRTRLIQDIAVPKNKWERYYARMEYRRIGWHDLWQVVTHIEVKYEN